MDSRQTALALFSAPAGRGREQIVIDQHNGQQTRDPFNVMVEDLCNKTTEARFDWKKEYTNISLIRNRTRASTNDVAFATKARSGVRIALKVKKLSKLAADGSVKSDDQIAYEFAHSMFELHFLNIVATKEHPRILRLLDAWVVRKHREIYIETECCDKNMGTIMAESRYNISTSTAVRYMKQMLEGLCFCHNNKIIHGDIKEENILVRNGEIKICDFEMSRMAHPTDPNGLIQSDENINDRRYQPIELLLLTPGAGFPVDVYALGCIFAKMFYLDHDCQRETHEGLFETFDGQRQLDLIAKMFGDINEWYFENGRNPRRLTRPTGAQQGADPRTFSEFMYFLPRDELMIDLIRRMMEPDQAKRISAHAALTHLFFYDHAVRPSRGDSI